MASRSQPINTQVRRLRIAGAALYTSGTVVIAFATLRLAALPFHPQTLGRLLLSIISPWTNMLIAAYCVFQCGVIAAQSQLMVATELRPAALGTALWPAGQGWLRSMLRRALGVAARLAAHGRSMQGAQRLVTLLIASLAAGVGCMQLFLVLFGIHGALTLVTAPAPLHRTHEATLNSKAVFAVLQGSPGLGCTVPLWVSCMPWDCCKGAPLQQAVSVHAAACSTPFLFIPLLLLLTAIPSIDLPLGELPQLLCFTQERRCTALSRCPAAPHLPCEEGCTHWCALLSYSVLLMHSLTKCAQHRAWHASIPVAAMYLAVWRDKRPF